MQRSGGPPLVGREAELARLESTLEAAAAGRFQLTVIEGEAGIGKSRLLETATARAAMQGFEVRSAAAWELEEARLFGPICDALGDGWDAIEQGTSEAQVVDAAIDALEDLAAARPLMVVIDDLQWADPSTLLVVRSAARRLRAAGVWLLLALRPVPRSARLSQLLALLLSEGAEHLTMPPLADAAVADLVANVVGAPPSDALASSLTAAHGNPFYVLELIAALEEEGALARGGDVADLTMRVVPPRLRTTILRRLGFLPAATVDALKTACLLGTTFSFTDVAAVGDYDIFDLTAMLQPALDAGVVTARGDALGFRHDLVHEALYHDRPLAVRKALHRAAGTRLAGIGAPAARVATQMGLGAEHGDGEALRWIGQAMEDAFGGSVGVTGEFARRGVELAVPGTAAHGEFVVWWLSCLYWAGAASEVESEGGRLLGRLSGDAYAKAQFMIGAALEAQGRLREAMPRFRDAVDNVGDDNAPSFVAERALRLARAGDFAAAEEAAKSVGAAAADELHVVISDMVLCQAAGGRGDVAAAVEYGTAAARRADRHWQGARFGFPFAYWSQGWALVDADQLGPAYESFREGRRIAEARGVTAHLPMYQASLGLACYLAGDLEAAMVESIAGLELVEELQLPRAAAMMHAVVARVRLHLGDVGGAADAIDLADRQLAGREPEFGTEWLEWARSHLLHAAGEETAARNALDHAWSISEPLRYFVSWRTLAPDLVRLAVAQGNLSRADEVAGVAQQGAARAPDIASARAAALWCDGLVADNDAAVMQEAVDAARRSPRLLARARLYEDAAGVLRHRDRDRSVELLTGAVDLYVAAGAEFDVARVRQLLPGGGARAGAGRRGPTRDPRPVTGWGSLTAAESRIAGLVCEGLSNPQIAERLYISRRTVQAHLSSVFRKLGVSSRAQLIVEAAKGQPMGGLEALADRGLLTAGEVAQLLARYQEIEPRLREVTSSSLLHGDLWSGHVSAGIVAGARPDSPSEMRTARRSPR